MTQATVWTIRGCTELLLLDDLSGFCGVGPYTSSKTKGARKARKELEVSGFGYMSRRSHANASSLVARILA